MKGALMSGVWWKPISSSLLVLACGSGGGGGAGAGAGAGGGAGPEMTTGEVFLGVPGGDDGLDFAPLEDSGILKLQTFGQGGTHVLLGVRCIGFGSRAFVTIRLRNTKTGKELVAPAPTRPQLLFCEAEVCDLVPLTVMASGLTEKGEARDGLAVEVSADVHNTSGVSGSDSKQVALSTADL